VWGRESAIMSLAAALTGDEELLAASARTFETLLRHQGPHGEIPSNVDPVTGRISYGGTAGRVDADLWLIVGVGEYWRRTGDDEFLERHLPALEKVRHLRGAWEFNNRGLLYIPLTGDWADEYLQHGSVLYDQLLNLQVQRSFAAFHPVIEPVDDDWDGLQMTFSYTFKNRPCEYHNGGSWPLMTGFCVADLARRGLNERALRFVEALHRANALEMEGEEWSFPEFVHGEHLVAKGVRHQGWSAAAAVIAERAMAGEEIFGCGEDGT
jgi:glycogen debranching enzyme